MNGVILSKKKWRKWRKKNIFQEESVKIKNKAANPGKL